MGWGNCGTDSKDRPIGYRTVARCDHGGCQAVIDRGIAYACGGMHGVDEFSCDGYFCGDHRRVVEHEGQVLHLCFACADLLDASTAAGPCAA